jgi:ribonuclease HII
MVRTTQMLVCGADEAGRGSVIGPLVIAGVLMERSKIIQLSEIGVKDSKELPPYSREILYKKIIALVDNYYFVRIQPRTIDKSVRKNQLNQLEGYYMAKVIKTLGAGSSYVDSCDINPKRFGTYISNLAKTGKVHSSHHADRKYPIVSAASIIAKVTRDRAIDKLRQKHYLGSGYPSDPKTMEFIKKCIFEKRDDIPPFIRKSWKPVKNLLGLP